MALTLDKDNILSAYQKVRSDSDPTNWYDDCGEQSPTRLPTLTLR